MWFFLVASASATCLNVVVSPSTCAGGEAVVVTVDCDGEPVPPGWDLALQQDGGAYGAVLRFGELVDGVADATCIDPGLPCDAEQVAYVQAVATNGAGGQEWAFTRLVVQAPACEGAGALAAGDTGDPPAAEAPGADTAAAGENPEAPPMDASGCGGGGGLATAGLLVFALRGRRR